MHYRTTQVLYTVGNTSQSMVNLFHCLQQNQLTPKSYRHVWYTVWILDLFSLWNMCIYTVVYVYDVMSGFSLVEILSEMGSHVSPPTCLGISDWTGISAVTVSLWRSHHDLSDSADSTIVYWLQLPCSVPVLFVSLSLSKCCMVLTWPSECSQTNILSLWMLLYTFSCLPLCEICKLIFHWN